MSTSKLNAALYRHSPKLLGLLAASALLACGPQNDIMGSGDVPPFGGRVVHFNSSYVYFPSDFSMSIVRDTMSQEDACRILNMYAGSKPALAGLPILPHKDDHYALVITVDSVMAPDEVSLEMEVGGGAGDMRYAGIGLYSTGNNRSPLWAARAGAAGSSIRISELQQYKRVAGRFNLHFDTGERIAEDFAIDACPK